MNTHKDTHKDSILMRVILKAHRFDIIALILGVGCLTAVHSKAHADLPTISIGGQCGTHSFVPSPEYRPHDPLLGCGLLGDIEVLNPGRHRLDVQLSWRSLHRESYLFDHTLSWDREIYDIGLSYHYELWPMLHPYMLVSAGLAYDTLNLSFTEELSAELGDRNRLRGARAGAAVT